MCWFPTLLAVQRLVVVLFPPPHDDSVPLYPAQFAATISYAAKQCHVAHEAQRVTEGPALPLQSMFALEPVLPLASKTSSIMLS